MVDSLAAGPAAQPDSMTESNTGMHGKLNQREDLFMATP
jgi:hypothetical protein